MAAAAARLALIAAVAVVAGAGTGAGASASACSTEDAAAADALASELLELFAGQLTAETATTAVPSSCVTAFQSADADLEARLCTTDCASWLQEVLARGACESEAMEEALVATTSVVAKCQARRLRFANARDYEREDDQRAQKTARNLRGLAARDEHDTVLAVPEDAAASPEKQGQRQLSIKGLLDAILVLTLNQAL